MKDKKLKLLSKQCETFPPVNPESDLPLIVTQYLRKLGISPNLTGFTYLRGSIIKVINCPSKINSIMQLYNDIAKQNSTTPSRVEHSIRYVITLLMKRGNYQVIDNLFSYIINSQTRKPSNSEFIAIIADDIRLNLH